MRYIFKVRKLVSIIEQEMKEGTDLIDPNSVNPRIDHCMHLLEERFPRMNKRDAKKILAIATGEGYVKIDNTRDTNYYKQELILTSKGLILLTPTGTLNAAAGSVAKIPPLVATLISLGALIISIFAYNKVH